MKNEMTKKDWEKIDEPSRNIMRNFLSAIGACDIGGDNTDNKQGICSWDLSCTIHGKPVSVEIKDRNMPHTRFSDMMIEQIKQDCNNRRIARNEFAECLVASVYSDGVICLANINDRDAVRKTRYCRQTTLVKGASHDYVFKEVVLLPQRKKIRYEVRDGKFVFREM